MCPSHRAVEPHQQTQTTQVTPSLRPLCPVERDLQQPRLPAADPSPWSSKPPTHCLQQLLSLGPWSLLAPRTGPTLPWGTRWMGCTGCHGLIRASWLGAFISWARGSWQAPSPAGGGVSQVLGRDDTAQSLDFCTYICAFVSTICMAFWWQR
jgi:hypothetical protein